MKHKILKEAGSVALHLGRRWLVRAIYPMVMYQVFGVEVEAADDTGEIICEAGPEPMELMTADAPLEGPMMAEETEETRCEGAVAPPEPSVLGMASGVFMLEKAQTYAIAAAKAGKAKAEAAYTYAAQFINGLTTVDIVDTDEQQKTDQSASP